MTWRELAGWLALRRAEQVVLALICLIFLIGWIARTLCIPELPEGPEAAEMEK